MLNIRKNSIKFFINNFLLYSILFGVFMSVYYIFKDGLQMGIIIGATNGMFFGLFFSLFALYQRKKFKTIIQDTIQTESVIYDGEATHFKRIEGVGGWLFLTSNYLLFKSHKLNIQSHESKIDISEIKSVTVGKTLGLIPNRIIINKTDGNVDKFTVYNRKLWVDKISNLLK